jgi:hypothetical protein
MADPEKCKKLFLESIDKAPLGNITLTSCDIDQFSTDDDTRGGRYNGSLIECLDDWFKEQSEKPVTNYSASLSVVAAHECAAERTRKLSGGNQSPKIEKPRSLPYFPIAVFA